MPDIKAEKIYPVKMYLANVPESRKKTHMLTEKLSDFNDFSG